MPEQQAAGERAVGAADPAENDRREHRQQQLEADVRVERALDEARSTPARPASAAGDRPR